jgi:hypothetical protein
MRRRAVLALLVLMGAPGRAADDVVPEFLKIEKLPDLDLRWVDFGWSPEAFDAMEKGTAHPAARRSWMMALLRLPLTPRYFHGRAIPVGANVLILHPREGETPMRFEMRDIDMRDMYVEPNVIGPPPKGAHLKTVPVTWDKVATTAERLTMTLTEEGRTAVITIHYGDRQTKVRLDARPF